MGSMPGVAGVRLVNPIPDQTWNERTSPVHVVSRAGEINQPHMYRVSFVKFTATTAIIKKIIISVGFPVVERPSGQITQQAEKNHSKKKVGNEKYSTSSEQ